MAAPYFGEVTFTIQKAQDHPRDDEQLTSDVKEIPRINEMRSPFDDIFFEQLSEFKHHIS